MLEARLVQYRLFRERTYALQHEQIRVTDRTPLASQVYDVPYEVLFGDRIEHVTTSREALILLGATALFTVLSLIAFVADYKIPEKQQEALVGLVVFGLSSILCGICWLFSRRHQIQFVSGELSLYIRRDQPSVEVVEAFIEDARMRARERVRTRLLPLQRTTDIRKDRRLAFMLRDKGIITADECADFLERTDSPYRDN